MMMEMENERECTKDKTRDKAKRFHKGHHWHVEIRSSVIVCRACEAKIPKYTDPQFCPECSSGKDYDNKYWDQR